MRVLMYQPKRPESVSTRCYRMDRGPRDRGDGKTLSVVLRSSTAVVLRLVFAALHNATNHLCGIRLQCVCDAQQDCKRWLRLGNLQPSNE